MYIQNVTMDRIIPSKPTVLKNNFENSDKLGDKILEK